MDSIKFFSYILYLKKSKKSDLKGYTCVGVYPFIHNINIKKLHYICKKRELIFKSNGGRDCQ